MSDLLDEDLEFRGGTLQLSTDHPISATAENTNAAETRTPTNVHPSVLSGADSLTSSSSSFAGKFSAYVKRLKFTKTKKKLYLSELETGECFLSINEFTHIPDARTTDQPNAEVPTEPVQTVYPRYDVPFNHDNIKDFFTFRKGVVENAIQECITGLLFPEDGEYLGCWLLTE